MKTPTTEEIDSQALLKANSHRFINGTHRTGFIAGFTYGAEWMEQQLEPVITELQMENIKLKEGFRNILSKTATRSSVPSKLEMVFGIAENALKPKDK